MVNLWPGVPASCLCDKHLNAVLAEFNNLLLPSMRKGNSIKGYILSVMHGSAMKWWGRKGQMMNLIGIIGSGSSMNRKSARKV